MKKTPTYDVEKAAYDAKTNVARDNLVTLDERQGWVLTRYFYHGLTTMQHNGDGLRDEMAPLIYGMDVQREKKAAAADSVREERSAGSVAAGGAASQD